jgi:multidrug resistance protein, MATE family
LWRGLLFATSLGLLLILLQKPLIYSALRLLGGSEDVIRSAHLYCDARIWSAPAALANYVLLGALLGRRQVHRALALQVSINAFNALVAIAFVYGLHWGVAGLGGATALAEWAGLGLGLALILPRIPRGFPALNVFVKRSELAQLASINRDIFLRTMLLLLGFGWFTHASATLSDVTLAANALLLNLQTFMAFGLDGFAHVAEALVGIAVGRRDRALFLKVAVVTTQWAGLIATCFSIVYFVGGPTIINVLTNEPEIHAAALTYLPWAAASPLISVRSFQLDGIFIGATRTSDLRNAAFASTAVFVLAAIALRWSLGNHGLWLAFSLFMVSRGVTLAGRFPAILRSIS